MNDVYIWLVFDIGSLYYHHLQYSSVLLAYWIPFDYFGIVDHEYNDWMGSINHNQFDDDNPTVSHD